MDQLWRTLSALPLRHNLVELWPEMAASKSQLTMLSGVFLSGLFGSGNQEEHGARSHLIPQLTEVKRKVPSMVVVS